MDCFDAGLPGMLSDEKRRGCLTDIAGLHVVHVPRELAPIERNVLDAGGNVYAETCGESVASTYPWPEQQEIEGGVVLPCIYLFKPAHSYIEVLKDLRYLLSKMEADNIMAVLEM
ncbi:hypothetical protein DPMN_144260 [Dreissena polymorpha]|uniref:Uncharacterized protein n=1 Tax=Dreissena polymorpha TaxID=45954 RepID=A0A9D4GHU9_DREPO|nr:hypothetical protein DPMN_144260 [Dreissena polymorpha]